MKPIIQEMLDDMKDNWLILVTSPIAVLALCMASFAVGSDHAKREAIKSGHAFWASDQYGNPEFRWKEQQQVIGEYLGLNKK
jgi:hypothetical protein